MRTSTGTATRFVLLAMFAPLVAACTTTSTTTPAPTTAAAQAPAPVAIQMPKFPQFARSNVDSSLANPCITAAANRYYIPEKVISAVDSRSGGGGNTEVILKVDSRDVVCSISANGAVRSISDVSPMSADQRAANEAARNAPAVAPKAAAPAKKAPTKKSTAA